MKKDYIYIVTGAAGHLGGTVVRYLNELGQRVFAFCLFGEQHLPVGEHVSVFFGDICDTDSLVEMFERCGGFSVVLIHCAGIVSIASKFNQKVYDVNVGGTKNIIALCEKYHVERLVYVSSVHAIPELPGNEMITEVDNFSADNVHGLYAKTKAEATQCVLDYAKRGGKACVVHPAGIVGPGDFGRGHITQLVIDFYKGRLTSGLNGGYNFVDVRDVANGILSCCENGKNGECYILSGQYFKVPKLLELLHEITGKRKVNRILPLWFVKLTAPFAELYYKILKQPPLFTTYSIYTLNTNANFNNDKAVKELGYTVRTMTETLNETVVWLKENERI